MEKYETYKIPDTLPANRNKIYFFLKNEGFSENYIKNLRNNPNALILNGEFANLRTKLTAGDVLKVAKSPNSGTQIALCDGNLDILFEDDDFLIVCKPANLACTPTRSHYSHNLGGQICKYMQQKDPDFVLRVVNRLDRETCGIVVVAKSVLAYKNAQNIQKTYYAICHGTIAQPIKIDQPIHTVTENGINQMKRIISPLGKRAVTFVQPIQQVESKKNLQENAMTLIKVTLETGRTHQIRVHLSHIGHPLLNDTIYSAQDQFPHNQTQHAMLILKEISFVHFRTKNLVHIAIPYPDDFSEILGVKNDK